MRQIVEVRDGKGGRQSEVKSHKTLTRDTREGRHSNERDRQADREREEASVDDRKYEKGR